MATGIFGRFLHQSTMDSLKKEFGKSARETADNCQRRIQSGSTPDFEDILSIGYRSFLKVRDVALDIGAHQGYHTERILDCVGASGLVICFEPVPDFCDIIRSKLNGRIDLRRKALSTEPGVGEFLHMTKAVGESGFKERTTEMDRGAKKISVEISTLDIELRDLANLAYIKIDTEGHEISALQGGKNLLARTRPVISIEYGKPAYSLYNLTAQSLYDFAEANGYRISDLFGNLISDINEWLYVCDRGYWDYYLVPKEKKWAW
ncbi:FkbM family methyltransferase [Rhizobium rhizogenes]|uniref:FkbM family methyltransferase n=1 Tax=Rhizobium rhizogenes TaxID=359 RepID=UPI00068FF066|nr:FkbM family methyltransferase [Rhizobium rhizogenes]NTJ22256.1 FkbM family methyltransferase [Rhizobium rhizogenes]QUE80974.1 FkbM family methyltransferase [Rhizobium rhizogenes]TQO80922.1 FkbM family methyltransferase [Rhizobium rhizogenes]TRB51516.1 FkbM family methyltransferase [Rhizobium rhizogenes]